MSRKTMRYLQYMVHGITEHPRRSPRRRQSGRGPARNWKYRAWVRTLPCAVCGIEGKGLVEAAHTGDDGGMRQKASDYSCIPLCADHHTMDGKRAYHGLPRQEWEQLHGVDIATLVERLNHAWFAYSGMVK